MAPTPAGLFSDALLDHEARPLEEVRRGIDELVAMGSNVEVGVETLDQIVDDGPCPFLVVPALQLVAVRPPARRNGNESNRGAGISRRQCLPVSHRGGLLG